MAAAIEYLPQLIYPHVVSFLEPNDGVKLSTCSRSLYRLVPLSCLEPAKSLPNRNLMGEYRDGDDFVRCYRLPVWMPRVHSLRFACNWADQGWGNRKSRLAIVAFPSTRVEHAVPTRIARGLPGWGGGRLVYMTPTDAPHQEEALRVTLPCPRHGEVFFLFARSGGGGGHSVRFSDAALHTIIFDEEDRCVSKTFRAMNAVGLLERNQPTGFGLDLLGTVIKMLLHEATTSDANQNPMCAQLVRLLEGHGFTITRNSLNALEKIRECWASEQKAAPLDEGEVMVNRGFYFPRLGLVGDGPDEDMDEILDDDFSIPRDD